jgi:hypothetical protein
MNDELHEAIIAFTEHFHALKTEIDHIHPNWQVALRQRDFDRLSRLVDQERNLISEAWAVVSAFEELIAQEQRRTQASLGLQSPPA